MRVKSFISLQFLINQWNQYFTANFISRRIKSSSTYQRKAKILERAPTMCSSVYVTHKICTIATCCRTISVICCHAFRLFVEKLYLNLIPAMIYGSHWSVWLVCALAHSHPHRSLWSSGRCNRKRICPLNGLRYHILVHLKVVTCTHSQRRMNHQ